MANASIHTIKEELNALPAKQVIELCLRLGRYKKENKELLAYLLFSAADITSFINEIKEQVEEDFKTVNKQNLYLAKKSLRKILRNVNKQVKFSLNKQVEVELRLHFLLSLKNSGIVLSKNKALENMYIQQAKKVKAAMQAMHEDIQYDYKKQLESVERI